MFHFLLFDYLSTHTPPTHNKCFELCSTTNVCPIRPCSFFGLSLTKRHFTSEVHCHRHATSSDIQYTVCTHISVSPLQLCLFLCLCSCNTTAAFVTEQNILLHMRKWEKPEDIISAVTLDLTIHLFIHPFNFHHLSGSQAQHAKPSRGGMKWRVTNLKTSPSGSNLYIMTVQYSISITAHVDQSVYLWTIWPWDLLHMGNNLHPTWRQ